MPQQPRKSKVSSSSKPIDRKTLSPRNHRQTNRYTGRIFRPKWPEYHDGEDPGIRRDTGLTLAKPYESIATSFERYLFPRFSAAWSRARTEGSSECRAETPVHRASNDAWWPSDTARAEYKPVAWWRRRSFRVFDGDAKLPWWDSDVPVSLTTTDSAPGRTPPSGSLCT